MHPVQYSGLTGLMHFEEVRGELLLQLLVLKVSSVVCKILSAKLLCAKLLCEKYCVQIPACKIFSIMKTPTAL